MTFAEFYQRLKNIAATRPDPGTYRGERHFCAQVVASPFGIEWRAYIAGPGWTSRHNSKFPCDESDPESVLRTVAAMLDAYEQPPLDIPEQKDPAGLDELGGAPEVAHA